MMLSGKSFRVAIACLFTLATLLIQLPTAQAAATNAPPVVVDDSATTSEERAVVIPVLANDVDPDGDVLILATVDVPGNGRTQILRHPRDPVRDRVRYTPNRDFFGTDSFTYTACDEHNACATAVVTVTVTNRNDRPRAVSDEFTIEEDVATDLDVLANDFDPDGDPLAIVRVTRPRDGTAVLNDAGTADPTDDTVRYTPAAEFSGNDRFLYRICDPSNRCRWARVRVTVIAVNDPPAAADDVAVTDEDVPVIVDVLANDHDIDGRIDPTTVTISAAPANGAAAADPGTGAVTYTPNPDFFGVDRFEYSVCDDGAACATAVVAITVAPVPDSPSVVGDVASVEEDGTVAVDVLANDEDPDGDVLAIASSTSPSNGVAVIDDGGSPGDPTDDRVIYTPAADFFGSDEFTYRACDPSGRCGTATVAISVDSVNDAPIAIDDAATTDEDQAVVIAVLANDSDIDGTIDPSTVEITSAPSLGTVAVDLASGAVTYVPSPDVSGVDSFDYSVCDDEGACASAGVLVSVLPVNDAPVTTADTVAMDEDMASTIAPQTNDFDVDGDELIIAAISQPNDGSAVLDDGGSAGDGSDDVIRITPNPDFHGSMTMSYTVCDPAGACAGGLITIDVLPVNDAPVGTDDEAAIAEDTPLMIAVLDNDADVDGDDLAVTGLGPPSHGTAAVDATGTVTYVPDPNFNGADRFTYELCDPSAACDEAIVHITVTPVNDAPVGVVDTAVTDEDTAVVIAVLANDRDVDGDSLRIVSVSAAAAGSVHIEGDRLRYRPAADANGSDSFGYVICDQDDSCTSAEVGVDVRPVNDPPVAIDDEVANEPGGPVAIDVVANDVDVDGDVLTVSAVGIPDSGSAAIADGSVVYTPSAGFVGEAGFTYTVCDGGGACASGTVTVDVKTLGAVTGVVYLDRDRDGTLDAGESTLSGVRLTLTDAGGDGIVGTEDDRDAGAAVTGSPYWFRDLRAGIYEVRVDSASLSDGLVAAQAQEGTAAVAVVTVDWGTTVTSVDFGFVDPGWFVANVADEVAAGETLPRTGVSSDVLVMVGSLLAAAGWTLVLLTRRARPEATAGS